MTCHNGFVRKKSQTRRQRKPRKQAVPASSKEISVTDNDARQGHDPMTAFPEFATPADIASMRQAASRALSKGRVAAIGMVSSIFSRIQCVPGWGLPSPSTCFAFDVP